MATRQNSTNGKPKSPRIQVVLPESVCEQLTIIAQNESRTISNMAKVLIQQGIKQFSNQEKEKLVNKSDRETNTFRDSLENQGIKRLKGAPQRIRYYKKTDEK